MLWAILNLSITVLIIMIVFAWHIVFVTGGWSILFFLPLISMTGLFVNTIALFMLHKLWKKNINSKFQKHIKFLKLFSLVALLMFFPLNDMAFAGVRIVATIYRPLIVLFFILFAFTVILFFELCAQLKKSNYFEKGQNHEK